VLVSWLVSVCVDYISCPHRIVVTITTKILAEIRFSKK
jgi:hypothetical protein